MAAGQTHVFRASLTPKVYREIEMPSTGKLYDLAEAIIRAFDFSFDHAFGFYSKLTGNMYDSPVKYELFVDMGEADSDAKSVKRTTVAQAFPRVGSKLLFHFDYGDDWQFRVELMRLGERQPGVRSARLVKSVGEAPAQYADPDEEDGPDDE